MSWYVSRPSGETDHEDGTMAEEEKKRTALVLGGGGSKGAVQAGFLHAVDHLDIQVDLIVAASVGAINGAFYAAGMSTKSIGHEWIRVRRGDLFSFNWNILRYGTGAESIFGLRRFRRFISSRLPVSRFDELEIPLAIITTDLLNGRPYVWHEGDLVDAIVASSAVPGLLPPVRGPDDRLLIDGALADNVPIETAFDLGADRILGILCRTCGDCRPSDVSLITILGQAFGIAVDCKWRTDARRYVDHDQVLMIEPEIGTHIPSLDFSHGKQLWREGYRRSLGELSRWLEKPEPDPDLAGAV